MIHKSIELTPKKTLNVHYEQIQDDVLQLRISITDTTAMDSKGVNGEKSDVEEYTYKMKSNSVFRRETEVTSYRERL